MTNEDWLTAALTPFDLGATTIAREMLRFVQIYGIIHIAGGGMAMNSDDLDFKEWQDAILSSDRKKNARIWAKPKKNAQGGKE